MTLACMSPLVRIARAASGFLRRADHAAGLSEDSRERGAATVEFVILLPIFLAVFLSSFEASLLLARQVMLERGVDIASRDIRLDSSSDVSQEGLRDEVCARARILPDCRDNLLIELTEIDQVSWNVPSIAQPCVNRRYTITPETSFASDRAAKLILMRACFSVSPFMPGVGIGAELVSDFDGRQLRMVASTAFMVEP